MDAKGVDAAAPKLYSAARLVLVLVAGDERRHRPRAHALGVVTILEPEKESATVKTLPKAASK